MNEKELVSVSREDLCRITDAVNAIIHDLDNGKYKYLRIELAKIHDVTAKWGEDETVLGGGCYDHKCRLCQELPTLMSHKTCLVLHLRHVIDA